MVSRTTEKQSSGWQSLQQIHAEAAGQPEQFDMHILVSVLVWLA